MLTAMGFVGAAVVALVIGLTAPGQPRTRHAWLASTALLVVIAFDDLFRLHNDVTGGDVAHLAYWVAMAAVIVTLRHVVWRRRGSLVVVAGLVLFAISETIDTFTAGDDPSFRFHQLFGAIEESAACVGAWVLTVALVGIVTDLVRVGADPFPLG